MHEYTAEALRDLAAADLHTILREAMLTPFMTDRRDAGLIADRVAAGEELCLELDLDARGYVIRLGDRRLQTGHLADCDSTREIFEATGALLVAALNKEPEDRRRAIAERLDDTAVAVSLRVGRCAEAITVQLGEPAIFAASRVSEATPDMWIMPEPTSLN